MKENTARSNAYDSEQMRRHSVAATRSVCFPCKSFEQLFSLGSLIVEAVQLLLDMITCQEQVF